MNAAARLVHRGIISRHLTFVYLLTKRQATVMVLALSILISALGIIYVTHISRSMYAEYQHFLLDKDRLLVARSQLLLERGNQIMQARTQQIATDQLGMFVPNHQSVVIIHE